MSPQSLFFPLIFILGASSITMLTKALQTLGRIQSKKFLPLFYQIVYNSCILEFHSSPCLVRPSYILHFTLSPSCNLSNRHRESV